MHKPQGIRPAHLHAKHLDEVHYSPRTSSLINSAQSSPTPSLSHNIPSASTSDASPPSVDTSLTSWETSWFHDESRAPSVFNLNRDSAITLDDSCTVDTDDWLARYSGDLDVSDDIPTTTAVDKAGNIPVFDAAGNSRLFRSLFSVGDVVGDRQLIIFIRHFFCGVS